MMDEKELEANFEELLRQTTPGEAVGHDDATRGARATALLGLATLKLNRSNARLARANFVLGVAIFAVAIIQMIAYLKR